MWRLEGRVNFKDKGIIFVLGSNILGVGLEDLLGASCA